MRYLLIPLIIYILYLIVLGCSKYIGISTTQAKKNLKTYLDREFEDDVSFKHLNRFFNAATMNPNIFSVLIYNTNIPEIECYLHLNLKTILEDAVLPLRATEQLTCQEAYQASKQRYDARQTVIAALQPDFDLQFDYKAVNITLDNQPTPEVLRFIMQRCVDTLNKYHTALNHYDDFEVTITTPEQPQGFVTFTLEDDRQQWTRLPLQLSVNYSNYNPLLARLTRYALQQIASLKTPYALAERHTIYIDTKTMSRAAWVQYLDDTSVDNTTQGPWINPQKGIYVIYFDLDSNFIYRGTVLTETNDTLDYTETFALIQSALTTEGIAF
ncbi:hypothetical protein JAO71_06930 [Olleya sp. YSTF-M6]|uniref:Lipoprotein n=1 Tax=Olleya sediminilitoris TaxID=2795739 RepID=A0ABS1WKD7_9FLAO|nr:hypothetical protein [Olleya sediminilitoris]MBL7559538.1 hypothetical protein [Olleya sediminilitoris]